MILKNEEIKLIKDDFKLRPEEELLLCCARTKVNPEIKDKIRDLAWKNLDWDYLIKMASRHRLKPLLYHNLNLVCPEMVPDDILGELREYFNGNVRKNLLLTSELIKILELLKTEEIEAVPYKGPVLASLAYGNLSLREFGDIDILINKSDALKVKELMISSGYELYAPIKIDDSFYMKLEPEYKFLSRDTGAIVEIKWKFEGNFFSLPDNSEYLFNDKEELNLNSFEVNTFSFVNQFLILCIHAAKHDWNSLSWVCDITELLRNQENIDWHEILDKSNKLSIRRILFINLLLAKDLFRLDIPEEILDNFTFNSLEQNISNEVKKRIFKNNSLNIFDKFLLDLKLRDNPIYGIKDCINGLTRPTYVDFEDMALNEYLYPLYYMIRPFLLLKRYGKDPI